MQSPASITGPLRGIRILDLTRVLAGPFCTQILGDLGYRDYTLLISQQIRAEIIKIEKPIVGDDTRSWAPPYARNTTGQGKPESAYFLCANRNKKSVTVNMKNPKGRNIIQQLSKSCDVLIENYIPGKLASFGLGYETLAEINPRLIYCSLSGYGPSGPYSKKPGYDVIIEAEAGLMHITGEQNQNPVKVGVAATDLITGLYAHGAIMAALIDRETTGKGQKVDVSLLNSQVSILANIASNYLIAGEEAQRWGTSHASIVPYRAFKTQDSFVVVGTGNDRQFHSLCKLIGNPEFTTDPKFSTNIDRVKHREELDKLLNDVFQAKSTAYWLEKLEGGGFPFGPVNDMKGTFQNPQVIHNKIVHEIDHPTAGKIKVVGPPVGFSRSKPSIRSPPPLLGQHTDEVLKFLLNYTDEDLKQLKIAKVI